MTFVPDPAASSVSFQTRHGTVRVVSTSRAIEADCWTKALAAHAKDARFYEVVEQTLSGQFDQRYFILKNAQTGAVAVQPFVFVDQDLAAGFRARVRRLLTRVRMYWRRLLTL